MPQVLPVENGDTTIGHERDRDRGVANAFRAQHAVGDRSDSRFRNRNAHLVHADVDDAGHRGTASIGTVGVG